MNDLRIREIQTPVVIGIVPGEVWCSKCGSVGMMPASQAGNRSPQKAVDTCICCGSTKLIPAASVLRPDEYYVRG